MITIVKLIRGDMKLSDLKNPETIHHAVVTAIAFAFVAASVGETFAQVGYLTHPGILFMAALVGGIVGKSIVI